jgi:hypothetical protein
MRQNGCNEAKNDEKSIKNERRMLFSSTILGGSLQHHQTNLNEIIFATQMHHEAAWF